MNVRLTNSLRPARDTVPLALLVITYKPETVYERTMECVDVKWETNTIGILPSQVNPMLTISPTFHRPLELNCTDQKTMVERKIQDVKLKHHRANGDARAYPSLYIGGGAESVVRWRRPIVVCCVCVCAHINFSRGHQHNISHWASEWTVGFVCAHESNSGKSFHRMKSFSMCVCTA